jgi:hypothetical protein
MNPPLYNDYILLKNYKKLSFSNALKILFQLTENLIECSVLS